MLYWSNPNNTGSNGRDARSSLKDDNVGSRSESPSSRESFIGAPRSANSSTDPELKLSLPGDSSEEPFEFTL